MRDEEMTDEEMRSVSRTGIILGAIIMLSVLGMFMLLAWLVMQ